MIILLEIHQNANLLADFTTYHLPAFVKFYVHYDCKTAILCDSFRYFCISTKLSKGTCYNRLIIYCFVLQAYMMGSRYNSIYVVENVYTFTLLNLVLLDKNCHFDGLNCIDVSAFSFLTSGISSLVLNCLPS